MSDRHPKPTPREVRGLNNLADCVTALGLAGLDDATIVRVLRAVVEAKLAMRRDEEMARRAAAPPPEPGPVEGWKDGRWWRSDWPDPDDKPT